LLSILVSTVFLNSLTMRVAKWHNTMMLAAPQSQPIVMSCAENPWQSVQPPPYELPTPWRSCGVVKLALGTWASKLVAAAAAAAATVLVWVSATGYPASPCLRQPAPPVLHRLLLPSHSPSWDVTTQLLRQPPWRLWCCCGPTTCGESETSCAWRSSWPLSM